MTEAKVAVALGICLLIVYWNDLFPPHVVGRPNRPSLSAEGYVATAPFVGAAVLLAWSSMRLVRGRMRFVAALLAIPAVVVAWLWLKAVLHWIA